MSAKRKTKDDKNRLRTHQRNIQTCLPTHKGPEYYLVFKDDERFIERAEPIKPDFISKCIATFSKDLSPGAAHYEKPKTTKRLSTK